MLRLTNAGLIDGPPQRILRELISLAYAHSKSPVPVAHLNDTAALRTVMLSVLSRPLEAQLHAKHLAKSTRNGERERHRDALDRVAGPAALREHRDTLLSRHYTDFERTAFAWLQAEAPEVEEFVVDVIDTIRCLRCADALCQRGTDLRTSGSYQIFIDQKTANAVYALHDERGRTFLLEGDNPLNAGEANLEVSEVTHEGDLRFAFFRGGFGSDQAVRRAAHNASVVVDDIQADVVESFVGVTGPHDAAGTRVLLEHTEDNPDFAPLVAELVAARSPGLEGTIVCAAAIRNAPELERTRFLAGRAVDWERDVPAGYRRHACHAALL